jgi:hypothetical protein
MALLLNNNCFNFSELYFSNYIGDFNKTNQQNIIDNFKKSKYGIIVCVYCLNEGWDFPLLDGVVFAENMSSNIRILQAALRPCRKNINEPNKIAKIILPILINDNWFDNDDINLTKIKEVVYQMGLEDETIVQKIKVFKLQCCESSIENKNKKIINNFCNYDDELTKKLRLKITKRIELYVTYEKAKIIIFNNNVKSKLDYYNLCKNDIRLPQEPETVFCKQFTNWIDYLNIERIYYNLNACKKKVNEYLIKHGDIRKHYLKLSIVCSELCEIDNNFPPSDLWIEYYNVDNLMDIIKFPRSKMKNNKY